MRSYNLNFNGYWLESAFSSVENCSGIYVFQECYYDYSTNTVSLKRILYIGQAKNCNERICKHDKIPEFKKGISQGNQLCITYCKCESNDLDIIENALIYYYKPPYNDNCLDTFEYETTSIICTGRYSLLRQSVNVYTKLSNLIFRR